MALSPWHPALLAAAVLQSVLSTRVRENAAGDPIVMYEWAVPANRSAADRYRNLTRQLILPTQQEPGCLHFDVYEDVVPGTLEPRIWQYLVFEDKAAHEAHMESSAVQTWVAAIDGLLKDSKLAPMSMADPSELPLTCAGKESSVVLLIEMYTEDVTQRALVQEASLDLISATRSEPGCVYYDQVVPMAAPGVAASVVQEILWFVDEEAHKQHMESKAVVKFLQDTASAKVQFNIHSVKRYSDLPPCPPGAGHSVAV